MGPTQLIINNTPIPWADDIRYLGVIMDKRLSWKAAICDRVAKTRAAAGAIHGLISQSSPLNRSLRLALYKICLRPVLTYGLHVWISASYSNFLIASRAQSRVLKIISGFPTITPTRFLNETLNIPSLYEFSVNLINRYKVDAHPNPLIRRTGEYQLHQIPYRLKKLFPLHYHHLRPP